MKKTMWVFFFHKYGKFWSILEDQKVERKPLFFEVRNIDFCLRIPQYNTYLNLDFFNFYLIVHFLCSQLEKFVLMD